MQIIIDIPILQSHLNYLHEQKCYVDNLFDVLVAWETTGELDSMEADCQRATLTRLSKMTQARIWLLEEWIDIFTECSYQIDEKFRRAEHALNSIDY